MNEEKIKSDWKKRGFDFGIWKDSAGTVWNDYVHDTDELFILADGKIELIISGKTIQPKIGEEILIPANTSHTVINTGKTTNKWYYGYKN